MRRRAQAHPLTGPDPATAGHLIGSPGGGAARFGLRSVREQPSPRRRRSRSRGERIAGPPLRPRRLRRRPARHRPSGRSGTGRRAGGPGATCGAPSSTSPTSRRRPRRSQRWARAFGRIDVLHFNPSAFREKDPLELTVAELLEDVALGVGALLTAVQAARPVHVGRRPGHGHRQHGRGQAVARRRLARRPEGGRPQPRAQPRRDRRPDGIRAVSVTVRGRWPRRGPSPPTGSPRRSTRPPTSPTPSGGPRSPTKADGAPPQRPSTPVRRRHQGPALGHGRGAPWPVPDRLDHGPRRGARRRRRAARRRGGSAGGAGRGQGEAAEDRARAEIEARRTAALDVRRRTDVAARYVFSGVVTTDAFGNGLTLAELHVGLGLLHHRRWPSCARCGGAAPRCPRGPST